ncbi:GSCOCG00011082001-RA-CDS [Cotesia congregata]|nr:GSCOCG00011082001-RA-CDS [Cotesia congregata]
MFNATINKYSANKRGNENQKLNCSKHSKHPDAKNLLFFQKIVKISEESYNMQQKEMLPERQTHQLSNVYTEPAPIKIKISPHYEIYLPRSTHLYIERKSEIARGKYDWRILVKETLLEVYGDTIKNYSAKGVRGGSPGINPELYRALYDWATTVTDEECILDSQFAECVNQVTRNKRKAKKIKGQKMQPQEN